MSRDSKIVELQLSELYYNLYIERLKIVSILGLIFNFLFSFLDYIFYRPILIDLLSVRIVIEISLIIFLVFLWKNWFSSLRLMVSVWLILMVTLINSLIFFTSQGAASPYYAGLTLIIVGITVILPCGFYESIVFCLLIIFSYLGVILASSKIDLAFLINNLSFLVTTSIVCMVVSYSNSKSRPKIFH